MLGVLTPLSIPEDQAVLSVLATIAATDGDRDTTSHGIMRYSITPPSNADNKFHIDELTGELTLIATLDRENVPTYTLTIRGIHHLLPALSTAACDHAATISIRVTLSIMITRYLHMYLVW